MTQTSSEFSPVPVQRDPGSGNALDEHDALFLINLIQANFDNFRVAGLNRAAYECRLDRQFAVPAVNQNTQADALGTPEIEQSVHRRANRAPRVQDVVHDD